MMATAAVIGLSSAGKRMLTVSSSSSSSSSSDIPDKLFHAADRSLSHSQPHSTPPENSILAKRTPASSFRSSVSHHHHRRNSPSPKALTQRFDTIALFPSPHDGEDPFFQEHSPPHRYSDPLEQEDPPADLDCSVDALLLLQKSILETQWSLCFERTVLNADSHKVRSDKTTIPVTCSGLSARQRRMCAKRKDLPKTPCVARPGATKQLRAPVSPDLLQNRLRGYVKGVVSNELLTHAQVVSLSNKIKAGLLLEDRKSRLKDKLGCEPSDEQLATSLRITRAELQSKLIECSLAREKLAMSNVRLVMSIAQRYDNMGAEMSDLVQGGLIGLLRGIEKFDSSKGFKISTYVYWWIRQGVSRALVENSRTLRLPAHLHERLGLIRNAKVSLEEKGIAPSIDRIAECLNMSQKKVRNATEAIGKVYSLDRDAFPSLNGLPGETHHSYIADNRIENNPWHGVDEWALKDEVNKLMRTTLSKRERDIIRLYYGLDNECLTWEDISKRIGLSRERVRQVGLVALEKLKHSARKRKMEAMLLKH